MQMETLCDCQSLNHLLVALMKMDGRERRTYNGWIESSLILTVKSILIATHILIACKSYMAFMFFIRNRIC